MKCRLILVAYISRFWGLCWAFWGWRNVLRKRRIIWTICLGMKMKKYKIQMKFGNHQKFICKIQTKMFNKIKKTQKKNNHTTILGKWYWVIFIQHVCLFLFNVSRVIIHHSYNHFSLYEGRNLFLFIMIFIFYFMFFCACTYTLNTTLH